MKNKYPIIILTCLMTILLPSCATIDPTFRQMESQIDHSPSPNAIVGAWRRKKGNTANDQSNLNLLFQENGQGQTYIITEDLLFQRHEKINKITWRYAGNGVWTSKLLWESDTEIKITNNDELLIYVNGSTFTANMMFIRQ